MIDRLHLTLMIGPVVPIPVGQDVLDALTEVEVTVGRYRDLDEREEASDSESEPRN